MGVSSTGYREVQKSRGKRVRGCCNCFVGFGGVEIRMLCCCGGTSYCYRVLVVLVTVEPRWELRRWG